jgi:hypothetical protein
VTADLERDGDGDIRPVLPVGLAIWASALRYPLSGAIAANRGERSEAPDWICAHIVG